jgi:AraC-like DNA-binding protein
VASRIGVSRSSFAARFMSLIGEPPMQYVRQWRFHVATRWLEDSDASIAEIAGRLDYNSEAAFGRAFKKFTGKTPGFVRRGGDSTIS